MSQEDPFPNTPSPFNLNELSQNSPAGTDTLAMTLSPASHKTAEDTTSDEYLFQNTQFPFSPGELSRYFPTGTDTVATTLSPASHKTTEDTTGDEYPFPDTLFPFNPSELSQNSPANTDTLAATLSPASHKTAEDTTSEEYLFQNTQFPFSPGELSQNSPADTDNLPTTLAAPLQPQQIAPFVQPRQIDSPRQSQDVDAVPHQASTPIHTTQTQQDDALLPIDITSVSEETETICLDIVLEASRELRYMSWQKFARLKGIPLRTLRAFVGPTGELTELGLQLEARKIWTPRDRKKHRMPPIQRKMELSSEGLIHASKIIGRRTGNLSRTMYCDLYEYDYKTVYQAIAEDGSITPWGRQILAKAARIASQARAALNTGTTASSQARVVPTANPDPIPSTSYTNDALAAAALRLDALAMSHDIALCFFYDGDVHKLGKRDAPIMGFIDQVDGQWRICPSTGREYRLDPLPDTMEHIVHILMLSAQSMWVLAEQYDASLHINGRAFLLTPIHGTLPAKASPTTAVNGA